MELTEVKEEEDDRRSPHNNLLTILFPVVSTNTSVLPSTLAASDAGDLEETDTLESTLPSEAGEENCLDVEWSAASVSTGVTCQLCGRVDTAGVLEEEGVPIVEELSTEDTSL